MCRAYGLSGSGKTFTVFGPDAADSPDAWYKHSSPHPLWGILPNMAYEIFNEKKEDWKITMKYFQNVVDIVRDLMSSSAQEKHYKHGMKKDADGFMDIEWCCSKVLHTWDDFRAEFMTANKRKAISPTQFNHQSTRGHCIMTLEVEKPVDDDPSRKQRGRLYVCDLAGTEPAAHIEYSQYRCDVDADGNKEYVRVGKHPDEGKTKELQEQGKKINLSLSEMAQFFMKMAEAIMNKRLGPGKSIPGCNSFFLCRFLKDTLLCAKTYLFCAIRPEIEFHSYTWATLQFAKNASVIKVQPRKATTAASAAERKLMEELEALKAAMEEMQSQNKALQAAKDDATTDPKVIEELEKRNAELQTQVASATAAARAAEEEDDGKEFTAEDVEAAVAAKLAGKVAEIQKMQEESTKQKSSAVTDEETRERYARYGIALASFSQDNKMPYFANLDLERFRNGVFWFILSKPEMTFGPGGDFRPQSLAVIPDHCTVTLSESGEIAVRAGQGQTFVNGQMLKKGETKPLKAFDRLAVGSELLILRIPGKEDAEATPPTPDEAVEEYHKGFAEASAMTPSGGAPPVKMEGRKGLSEEASRRIDAQIAELYPKLDQAKQLCELIDPSVVLEFDLTLLHFGLTAWSGSADDAEVGVNVKNPVAKQSIALSIREFETCFMLLNDELGHMQNAVAYGLEHIIPTEERPVVRFFDHMVHLGTSVQVTDIFQYNLDTDPEECSLKIISAAADGSIPVEAGKLEVIWTPLASPEDDGTGAIAEIESAEALLGGPWTYRIQIRQAIGLPSNVKETYAEYYFFGDRFTTAVQSFEEDKGCRCPDYEYKFVHHVPVVTKEFLEFLKQPIELKIFTAPYVFLPPTGISTNDPGVADRVRDPSSPAAPAAAVVGATSQKSLTGSADVAGAQADVVAAQQRLEESEKQRLALQTQLQQAQQESKAMAAQVDALQAEKAKWASMIRELAPSISIDGAGDSAEELRKLLEAVKTGQNGQESSAALIAASDKEAQDEKDSAKKRRDSKGSSACILQ